MRPSSTATCAYDERRVTTHTELIGDFKTAFRVKVESTHIGQRAARPGGQPINVHRTIIQDGKYIGESCDGLQAGEAKSANGATVNVQ
ncbi:MAG: hypothetical protein WDN31_03875 [Hyphomicrobium sp.]